MASFHISVKPPSQPTPSATAGFFLKKVPDQIIQLGLTKHTWDSLRNAIVAALRTPNGYNIDLEGHGFAWEAWIDEFLDSGIGDRFWPEKGMPVCWEKDKAVIREAVKSQALSIAAGERNPNIVGGSPNGLPIVLRPARMFDTETISAQGQRSPNQSGKQFTANLSESHDKPDETKIYTRKTRAAVKKPQGLERPRSWSCTPVFDEDKSRQKGIHETNQKIVDVDVDSSYLNEPDPPRSRRRHVRAKKINGWVAVNDKPTTIKRPASEEPVSDPVKLKRKKSPIEDTPDHPIELSSESVTNSKSHIPTPCLTPIALSTPALVSKLSSLVLETRLTTSPKIKFIYPADTPSLSHFLEKVNQKWMLSGTQRVSSIEIEVGDKVFDVDLGEERDWRAVLGIMERLGERAGVVIGVTE